MRFRHNSTIGIKEKICVSCGKKAPWFSKKRCQQCATIEDVTKRMEKESERMIEEEDLSSLIQDADAIYSQYVRLKYADVKGVASCYTCGLKKHWTLHQCGHYVKRSHLYLRWDERNTRVQCVECNEMKHGNMAEYTKRLDTECKGLPDLLRSDSILVHKPTREEIRQVIAEYTPKVKLLKSKLKS